MLCSWMGMDMLHVYNLRLGGSQTVETNTGNTQHSHSSEQKQVIYLPFTKLKNKCLLAIDIYSIATVQFQPGRLPLIRI